MYRNRESVFELTAKALIEDAAQKLAGVAGRIPAGNLDPQNLADRWG